MEIKIDFTYSETLLLIKIYNYHKNKELCKGAIAEYLECKPSDPSFYKIFKFLRANGILKMKWNIELQKHAYQLDKQKKDELEKIIKSQESVKEILKFYDDIHSIVI